MRNLFILDAAFMYQRFIFSIEGYIDIYIHVVCNDVIPFWVFTLLTRDLSIHIRINDFVCLLHASALMICLYFLDNCFARTLFLLYTVYLDFIHLFIHLFMPYKVVPGYFFLYSIRAFVPFLFQIYREIMQKKICQQKLENKTDKLTNMPKGSFANHYNYERKVKLRPYWRRPVPSHNSHENSKVYASYHLCCFELWVRKVSSKNLKWFDDEKSELIFVKLFSWSIIIFLFVCHMYMLYVIVAVTSSIRVDIMVVPTKDYK